jgi:hypothetical protein
MGELGTRSTIERVESGNSLPKVTRACALLDLQKGRCNSPGCNSSERRGSLVTRVPVAETVDNERRQQALSHLI